MQDKRHRCNLQKSTAYQKAAEPHARPERACPRVRAGPPDWKSGGGSAAVCPLPLIPAEGSVGAAGHPVQPEEIPLSG